MEKDLTNEEILADPKNLECLCNHDGAEGGMPLCSHRTICNECVIVHRVEGGIPTCIRLYTDHQFPLPDMKERFANEEAWLADPENKKCRCPSAECPYKGKCKECVALHRYHRGIPACFPKYPILSEEAAAQNAH